jgi:hypothetical protein
MLPNIRGMADADRDADRLFLLSLFGKETALVTPIFAREPERRLISIDCRLTVAGVTSEVDAELAGETVVVWWGLFDQELWVEHDEERCGPFLPVGGPIPLHRYRKHRKSRREMRADQVIELAGKLVLPRAALSGEDGVLMIGTAPAVVPLRPFDDPDPFHELSFASQIAARRAIAEEIRLPLAKLSDEERGLHRVPACLTKRSSSAAKICVRARLRPLEPPVMTTRLPVMFMDWPSIRRRGSATPMRTDALGSALWGHAAAGG